RAGRGRIRDWIFFRRVVGHRFDFYACYPISKEPRAACLFNTPQKTASIQLRLKCVAAACAQAREVRRLDPIERALAIQPNVTDQQDAQEDKHGYQPVSAQL